MQIITRFTVTITPEYFETHSAEQTKHITPTKPYLVIGCEPGPGIGYVIIANDIGELYWYKFEEVLVCRVEPLNGGMPHDR